MAELLRKRFKILPFNSSFIIQALFILVTFIEHAEQTFKEKKSI